LSSWAPGNATLPQNLTAITLIPGAFGPLIAAIIILRITSGVTGLKDWFKTTFNFRINFIWYLLEGIALPFLIAAVHHIIYLVFGGKSGIVFNLDSLTYPA
jgi:hypothetical protein